jgi:hypothetical protein
MRKSFAALALAATLAQPAAATTFPSLTTIYVGTGILDDGGSNGSGIATSFFCSNVSGLTANVRYLILNEAGGVLFNSAPLPLSHGASSVVSTHGTVLTEGVMGVGALNTAVVNIESTQSGVFCRAALVNAAGPRHDSSPISLVRVNPHPGTVE